MTIVTSYKLRVGSPQPAGNMYLDRYFVLQTFGAESQDSTMCEDKETLLVSDDMNGLGGEYQSANYKGKEFVTIDNVRVFDAEENLMPVFIDEDYIGISAGMFVP